MTTTFLAAVVVFLLLPLVLLNYFSQTPQQRAKRWRKSGKTYRVIADKLSVSQTTARRYCLS